MGLFDKKYCDICGEQIKLLGNRKLDDGNCCKDCAAKLSPWFTGRKRSKVADIKRQIEYRAANQNEVNKLNATKIIGERYQVIIDEAARKFAVTSSRDWRKANPDVLSFDQITACKTKITEHRTEVMDKDENGKSVSFDPKKYTYEYRFAMTLLVNHEYFDDMDFTLSSSEPEDHVGEEYKKVYALYEDATVALTGKEFAPELVDFTVTAEEIAEAEAAAAKAEEEAKAAELAAALGEGEWYCPNCGNKNASNFCAKCGTPKPVEAPAFCVDCGTKLEPGTKFCPKCGKKVA